MIDRRIRLVERLSMGRFRFTTATPEESAVRLGKSLFRLAVVTGYKREKAHVSHHV
jgi:hypothetical protein